MWVARDFSWPGLVLGPVTGPDHITVATSTISLRQSLVHVDELVDPDAGGVEGGEPQRLHARNGRGVGRAKLAAPTKSGAAAAATNTRVCAKPHGSPDRWSSCSHASKSTHLGSRLNRQLPFRTLGSGRCARCAASDGAAGKERHALRVVALPQQVLQHALQRDVRGAQLGRAAAPVERVDAHDRRTG